MSGNHEAAERGPIRFTSPVGYKTPSGRTCGVCGGQKGHGVVIVQDGRDVWFDRRSEASYWVCRPCQAIPPTIAWLIASARDHADQMLDSHNRWNKHKSAL